MAARLSIISSMATRHLLVDLAADFECVSGTRVDIVSIGGVEAARRLREGAIFDVVVLAADALERLAADGIVRADSVRALATSATAIAIPAGAAHPVVSDETSLKRLVADARAIGISTGPSGTAVRALLAKLGLRDDVTASVVVAPPGVPVAQLIARGQVDLGFQQLSELQGEPDIVIIGNVPETLVPLTTFSIAVATTHTNAACARAFIARACATDAAVLIHRHGMSPAT